jgi:8-oxo-dGTP pyrophosphatase MutT (NUDIX family)
VRAAGGVVWRRPAGSGGGEGAGRVEVLVVHRPRYDDWSFPKGKCDDGESFRAAAEREVLEETGLQCDLGEPIEQVAYTDQRGRPKVVRYWAMTVRSGSFTANEEVDEVAWLPPDEARHRLTYPHDAALLRRFST